MSANQRDEDGREIALEVRAVAGERLFSPSAARNREAIRDAFLPHMPKRGAVLEIGAGTGEHAVCLAAALPGVRWMPGDPDPASRVSIAAWSRYSALVNIEPPHALDVTAPHWARDLQPLDGVVSINMIHIAPFSAAVGLFDGAGKALRPGGRLFLYGPFSRNGAHTAPSNEAFDASLKARDPAWGVRDLEGDILPLAARNGLALVAVTAMPANNFTVVFEKG